MKYNYERRESKEANMANRRQGMMESEHNAKNSFVKKVQDAQAKNQGHAPEMKEKFMQFNANMVSDGEHATKLGAKLTQGIDKVAYPVRESKEYYGS